MGSALSSLVFLQYSDATVYEYDLGDEKKLAVAAFLHSLFGKDRLRLRWGDISTTVPNNAPKCDLVYLDAIHPLDVVLSIQYLSTETTEWIYHSGGSGDVKARQFFLREFGSDWDESETSDTSRLDGERCVYYKGKFKPGKYKSNKFLNKIDIPLKNY